MVGKTPMCLPICNFITCYNNTSGCMTVLYHYNGCVEEQSCYDLTWNSTGKKSISDTANFDETNTPGEVIIPQQKLTVIF